MINDCVLQYLKDNSVVGKKNLVDYKLQDDGKGVYIKKWDIEEIDAPKDLKKLVSKYKLTVLKKRKIKELKRKELELLIEERIALKKEKINKCTLKELKALEV